MRYKNSSTIPIKESNPELPNSWLMAYRWLLFLKVSKDLLGRYTEEMWTHVDPQGKTWYLPHQPVFNLHKPIMKCFFFDCATTFWRTALNSTQDFAGTLSNERSSIASFQDSMENTYPLLWTLSQRFIKSRWNQMQSGSSGWQIRTSQRSHWYTKGLLLFGGVGAPPVLFMDC